MIDLAAGRPLAGDIGPYQAVRAAVVNVVDREAQVSFAVAIPWAGFPAYLKCSRPSAWSPNDIARVKDAGLRAYEIPPPTLAVDAAVARGGAVGLRVSRRFCSNHIDPLPWSLRSRDPVAVPTTPGSAPSWGMSQMSLLVVIILALLLVGGFGYGYRNSIYNNPYYLRQRLRHHRPDPGVRPRLGPARTALMQCPTSPETLASTWAPWSDLGALRRSRADPRSNRRPGSKTSSAAATWCVATCKTAVIIATFNDVGQYANALDSSRIPAKMLGEEVNGLLVQDQWDGQPCHHRLIQFRNGEGDACNDGDRFYVVERP